MLFGIFLYIYGLRWNHPFAFRVYHSYLLCVKSLSYFLLSHISQRNFLLLSLDSEFSDVII